MTFYMRDRGGKNAVSVGRRLSDFFSKGTKGGEQCTLCPVGFHACCDDPPPPKIPAVLLYM